MNSAGLPAIPESGSCQAKIPSSTQRWQQHKRVAPCQLEVHPSDAQILWSNQETAGGGRCGGEGSAQPVQVRWSFHDSPPSLQNKSTTGRAALKIKRAGAISDSSSRPAPPPLPPRHHAQKSTPPLPPPPGLHHEKNKKQRSCLVRATAEPSLTMQTLNK